MVDLCQTDVGRAIIEYIFTGGVLEWIIQQARFFERKSGGTGINGQLLLSGRMDRLRLCVCFACNEGALIGAGLHPALGIQLLVYRYYRIAIYPQQYAEFPCARQPGTGHQKPALYRIDQLPGYLQVHRRGRPTVYLYKTFIWNRTAHDAKIGIA